MRYRSCRCTVWYARLFRNRYIAKCIIHRIVHGFHALLSLSFLTIRLPHLGHPTRAWLSVPFKVRRPFPGINVNALDRSHIVKHSFTASAVAANHCKNAITSCSIRLKTISSIFGNFTVGIASFTSRFIIISRWLRLRQLRADNTAEPIGKHFYKRGVDNFQFAASSQVVSPLLWAFGSRNIRHIHLPKETRCGQTHRTRILQDEMQFLNSYPRTKSMILIHLVVLVIMAPRSRNAGNELKHRRRHQKDSYVCRGCSFRRY